jgi:DNA-binding transcriptional LysR family regulator
VAGELALATSHHVGLHRLAPALRAFTRRFPDVHLDIRFEDSEDAHDLVRRAEAEIAVVTLNPNGDAGAAGACPVGRSAGLRGLRRPRTGTPAD